eukprot:365535-Chlamydomonas_euryale.AAC.33
MQRTRHGGLRAPARPPPGYLAPCHTRTQLPPTLAPCHTRTQLPPTLRQQPRAQLRNERLRAGGKILLPAHLHAVVRRAARHHTQRDLHRWTRRLPPATVLHRPLVRRLGHRQRPRRRVPRHQLQLKVEQLATWHARQHRHLAVRVVPCIARLDLER